MAIEAANTSDRAQQRRLALSRWDNEGGAGPGHPQPGALHGELQSAVPALTDAELVHLRVRVIALENVLLAVLAQAPDQQLALIREMAEYIRPRPGHTQHPLTIHASEHMTQLVQRAIHFRAVPPA
ncbi:MAG: hypothetical protein M3O62_05465 [Pseudomonadota bacterium]|nr:hypothetical protein [Pseudomonadota bacterium]